MIERVIGSFFIITEWKWKWRLFATPWTVAYQTSPPMGFSRQEYQSRVSFPSPGDLPNSGIVLRSPALQADALPTEPPRKSPQILRFLNKCGNFLYVFILTKLSGILEWVAYPYYRGFSQPRDRTQVFNIAGRFFTNWATRETQKAYNNAK